MAEQVRPHIFIEYKHEFADGSGLPEYQIYFTQDGTIDEYWQSSVEREYAYSEHYRGIMYNVVKRPPDGWLAAEIENTLRAIHYKQEYLTILQQYVPPKQD